MSIPGISRSVFGSVVAAGVVAGLVLTASPAQARSYTSSGGSRASTADAGGRTAWAALDSGHGGSDYKVVFQPHGERLFVHDAVADGHAARAHVDVFNKSGNLVDQDTFYDTTKRESWGIQLGTPDGSGNIAEGYRVAVRVCINGTKVCSKSYRGTA